MTTTTVNGADFLQGAPIDNPFLPWKPGTTFTYENADGSVLDTETVQQGRTNIDGVDVTVVLDEVKDAKSGQVLEHTLDYYAQDTKGNVWYFGEQSEEFQNGKLVAKDSWKAGAEGAQPGIIMEAHPKVGDSYDQENAPGTGNSPHVAQDHAQVTSLTGSASVPFDNFHHDLLVTLETSVLEPGAAENKYYAAGIGQVFGKDLVTGEQERLVSITPSPAVSTSQSVASATSVSQMVQAMASFGANGSGVGSGVAMQPHDEAGLHHTLTAHAHQG